MEKKDKPLIVNLEPGTHYLCTCNQSKNPPFCDGSHAGSEFTPQVETLTEKRTIAICACSKSSKGIFCDGAHSHK